VTPEPERIGDYVLAERVGFGGMADVFRAERRGLGGFVKVVAIKRILPHLVGNEEFVRMFVDEARIAASLSHANIVSIYDFGKAGSQLYLVMEYVDGCSLLSILERLSASARPVPLRHALFIALEVCKGLHAAHSRVVDGVAAPVVHRDVSPQNILISRLGEVRITDFGVAKAQGRLSNTQADTVKGKIAYMAPEQARGEPVDARCDIFSLGIVLHEMLTGRRLFKGEQHAQTLMQVLEKEIPLPSTVRPKLPADIDRIVMKALARDQASRYQRASELGRDLSQFLISTGIDATSLALADFVRQGVPDGRWQARGEATGLSSTERLGRLLDAIDTGPTDSTDPGVRGAVPGRPAAAPPLDDRLRARERYVALAKELAVEVRTLSDVQLWMQIALLGKLATLSEGSRRREKVITALVEAASGQLDEQGGGS
jgi:serine/threonine-protein kinase